MSRIPSPFLVFGAADHPDWRARARRGGAYGEILMMDSLAFGLERIGVRAKRCARLREFALARLLRPAAPIVTDPFRLADSRRHRLLSATAAARCLVLEWYGTPPDAASQAGTQASQYLVPYPDMNAWNSFLGYVLHLNLEPRLADRAAVRRRIEESLRRKRRQGVVWGKETRYFAAHAELLESLSSVCDLRATVSDDGGPPRVLPAAVINHGHLSRRALADSAFLIGLGDPVSGPSALEALAEGCVYLDPRYPAPRVLDGLAQVTVCSQHPYATTIGAPWVYPVDLGDASSVRVAAVAGLEAARAGAIDRLVERLAPFTENAYVTRLRGILGESHGTLGWRSRTARRCT